MKNSRQGGQNVSGFVHSFENKAQSTTRGPSRIPASARSITPTRRAASPPPLTLSSPPRTFGSSPPSSVESLPPVSRAASRANQMRSAENMIQKMERINGNVQGLERTSGTPEWSAQMARSASGSEARKPSNTELVLVNTGVEGDVSFNSTNSRKQKHDRSSSSKIVTEEKHITSDRDAGYTHKSNAVPPAKDALGAKAETGGVSTPSLHSGKLSSHQDDIGTLLDQPQEGSQSDHSSSSSSFDDSDHDTDVSEPFRSVREEQHTYDIPSPVSSQGDSGEPYGSHPTTSARLTRSFSVEDRKVLPSMDDSLSLMTLREKTRRYIAAVSEGQVEYAPGSDRDQSPPHLKVSKTPLEVTDTSLEDIQDSSFDISRSRSELKVKPGNPRDRAPDSSYGSPMFKVTGSTTQAPGAHTDKALHAPTVPRPRHRERSSRMPAISRSSDRKYGQLEELREPQWDTESENPKQVQDQEALQSSDEKAPKLPAATGRPSLRRADTLPHRSKHQRTASGTPPQKKEPELLLGDSQHTPESIPSSRNREAPISQNHEADLESSRAKPSPHHLRSSSVPDTARETGQTGKPPPFRRTASDADLGGSQIGRKDSLQPLNPRALPDAGAKLRNVIKKSINVTGVAAAFYRGGYLPIGGMSPDNSTADLNVFLRQTRREVEEGVPGRWLTAVLGSEAADLDSIFSSIAYAYLLHSTIKAEQQCFLPVINMRREDLPLHMEAVWLLEVAGIDVKSLMFVDEISLSYYHRFGSLRLVLVDHSRLALHQEALQEAIVEIVDHLPPGSELKKSENDYPWVLTREIEQVGSCCTLIAERFASEAPILLGAQGLRRILLAPILLDTGNLDKDAGQTTSRDETMVTLLLQGAGSYGRNGFYKLLRKKKFDTSVLNTKDLLRKDFNLWTFGPVKSEKHGYRGEKILAGMSSVGMTLGELLVREPDVVEHIVRFREWKRLRLLIIITGYYDRTSIFRRELLIAPEHPQLADDLAEYFNVGSDEGLKLKPLFVNGLPREMKAYSQGNATASRKKIQPMLFEFFCT